MNARQRRLGNCYAIGLALIGVISACGSSDTDEPSSASKGGGAGKGGTRTGGKGGTSGKAGSSSSGEGGESTGGTTAVGGTGGKGGSGNAGGTTGTAGAGMMTNPRCMVMYGFAANIDDAAVGYSEPSKLAADTELELSTTEGAGTPNALQVKAPFSAEDQLVRVSLTPYEYALTGLSLSVRVKLGKGLTDDEAHPGRARLAVKAGLSLVQASGPEVELVRGEWQTLRFEPYRPENVDTSGAAYNPSSVYGIEVEIFTGTDPDTEYEKAVVYIDDLSICKSPLSGFAGGGGLGGVGGRVGQAGHAGQAGGDAGAAPEASAGAGGSGGEGN